MPPNKNGRNMNLSVMIATESVAKPDDDHHQPSSASCSPMVRNGQCAFVFHTPGQPKQAMIDGEIWPPIFQPDCVRSAKALKARDSDVFVCTYPKCGTTWIQHICSQLLKDDYGPQVGHGKELCMSSPMIERMGGKYVDKMSCPRLLKSHFTYDNMPKCNRSRYIYAVRNPKDCLTSYFFHNRNFKIYDFEFGDFSAFFELFLSKRIAFGNYFDHLNSWLPHINDPNVLFLKYEDMCDDLRGAVRTIGQFLGGQAAKRVADPATLDRIVAESTLGSMKQNQWRWFPEDNLRRSTFIRKGGSGDWRNYFSRSQSQRLDAEFEKCLRGTEAEHWWPEQMAWLDDGDDDDVGIELDFDLNNAPVTEEPNIEPCEIRMGDDAANCEAVAASAMDDPSTDHSEPLDLTLLSTNNLRFRFIPFDERITGLSACSSLSSGYNSLSSSFS